jgi:hypothetical protein
VGQKTLLCCITENRAKWSRRRIRALVKGRFLKIEAGLSKRKGKKGKADALMVADEDAALEQQDLMEDQMLTLLQRKGKQAI